VRRQANHLNGYIWPLAFQLRKNKISSQPNTLINNKKLIELTNPKACASPELVNQKQKNKW
jgi:hypothetical protein